MTHQLLRASAGTGKTYRLVEAYAAEVLQRDLPPSEIIGITFTRKAALELKLRIRDRLRRAGAAPPVLAELGHAPLSNFHGLALQMLRGWGTRAGFTPTTEVLGESGVDRALFLQACEDAWFGGTAEAAEAVRSLAAHVTIDLHLPDALWEAVGRAREDNRRIDAQLVGTYAAATIQATAHARLLAFRQRLVAAAPMVTGKGKDKLAAFLAAPVPKATQASATWDAMWRAALEHLDRRGTLGKVFSADDQEMIEVALEGTRAEHLCAELAPALGLLLQEAWTTYVQAKARRQAMDFADIIERVVHLLETQPALHNEVRQRYRAVLVDEAQDTNRLQRRLIDLLAGLTGPAADAHPVARLFVVGDWKQSIYTFRGADPQSFDQFAADVRGRGGVEETLSVSRRSTHAVVRSVNHLGAALFGAAYERLDPLQPQDDPPPGITWCVLPDPTPDVIAAWHEAQGVAAHICARLHDGRNPGDFAVLMATMTTAPLVARALGDAGVPAVVGGGGGLYEQSEVIDILAMLTWLSERRERLSAAIALRSPLVGISDATLLQLAERGNFGLETLWRGSLPWTPMRGQGQPSLDEAGSRHFSASAAGESLLGAGALSCSSAPADLRDVATLERLAAHLPGWTKLARGHSTATLLEALDTVLQLRAVTLAQPNGEQRLANLHRLFALARAAEGQPVLTFVRQQRERMRQGYNEPIVPLPAAERRAVTISSVHQSKGLQYPVVVLASIARKSRNDTASLRYSRAHGLVFRPRVGHQAFKTACWRAAAEAEAASQEQELRRLLYVAVTRAEREVLVVAPQPETLGRDGFARLLCPWAAAAVQAGVLRLSRQKPPPSPRWQPVQEGTPPVHLLAPRAPAGTHFEVTVTQFVFADAAGEHAAPATAEGQQLSPPLFRPRAPDAGALDPRTRGSLAHAVLAALERYPEAPDLATFISTELARSGYEPSSPALNDVRADLRAFLTSSLGAKLLRLDPDARRPELPFALPVSTPPYSVCLRGKLDLLLWDEEGPLIVDYKHARRRDADLQPYLTQLEAYAWAIMRLCQINTPVRTYLVFLRDHDMPPLLHLVTPTATQALQQRLQAWVHAQSNWPVPSSPSITAHTAPKNPNLTPPGPYC